jgi:conjugal transfer ATP-binding protein TraC
VEISFVSETNSNLESVISAHESLGGEQAQIKWLNTERVKNFRLEASDNSLLKPNLHLFLYRRLEGNEKSSGLNFIKAFFQSAKAIQNINKEAHEKAMRELTLLVDSTKERLDANGIESVFIGVDEIRQMVFGFLNPSRVFNESAPKESVQYLEQEFSTEELSKVKALSYPSPRDQLVGSSLVQTYDSFYLDKKYHRIITLKTLPEFTHSALMTKLLNLDFPNLIHVHIKVPEQSKELSSLQAKRRMAHSMSMSHGGRATDLESEAKLQSTEELLRELLNTGQKIFYFQVAVLVRADTYDELEQKTKVILGTIRELNGAEAIAESVANFKLWKTLLPFGTTTTVRNKRVKTDNLADFLPVYEPYTGPRNIDSRPVCLFRNRHGGLVSYDPFDSSLPNYNTLVTGSSGSGKSFLNNLILLQYVSQKPLIFIIDIGGSYKKLCEFLNGQYIEIAPPQNKEECNAINPFALPLGETEPSPQKIKFLLALLENMLTDSEKDKLPKLDKSLLEEIILNLYTKNLCPTLSDLQEAMKISKDERLIQFSKMLYPWTGERPYGRLLDGKATIDLSSDVVVFDLKGLSSYPDLQSVMLLIITDFILGRVESKNSDVSSRRKQILMDECWELLKSQASASFMEYCVRTLRKTGSGITFITQGLEEIVASPIGSAILSNTATKFILMQKGDLAPIKKVLKFNEQEMALISSLRQAKGKYSEAFMIANEDRSVIKVIPTGPEYWLATSDSKDNATINELREQNSNKSLLEVIQDISQAV